MLSIYIVPVVAPENVGIKHSNLVISEGIV